jgi:catechol 2,3-dioxygenase-like lactoylglutathione lyase family enzyme/predicted enzyme related to lactoylglutathione lyase
MPQTHLPGRPSIGIAAAQDISGAGMTATVRGVRSVEIEMSDPERAAEFFSRVWNLTPVARRNGSFYFRGTGAYHHILAIHPAIKRYAVRRLVFDAATKEVVHALRKAVAQHGGSCEEPHALNGPGGGYGFGFADVEGRNLAIVCDVDDHADIADVRDRPRKIAHVNLNAAELAKSNAFLMDVLAFRLVDESGPLFFLHCDSTDHSSMVMGKAAKPTLNHVAFEMPDLDSVMRGGGRMRDNGYPIEWGPGRHGAGNNVFCYFAGPEEFPLEYTGEVQQIDESYPYHGPDYWQWPPGRLDQWGITPPHTQRWKRVQDLYLFPPGQYRLQEAE